MLELKLNKRLRIIIIDVLNGYRITVNDFFKPFWRKAVLALVTTVLLFGSGMGIYHNQYSGMSRKTMAAGGTYSVATYGSLQATINATPDGSNIYIPAGTWSGISSMHNRNNLTIYGDGATSILTAPGQSEVLGIYTSTNITLQDFAVNADYSVVGHGIGIFGLNGLAATRLTIKDGGNAGILSNGLLYNATFDNLNIQHCGDFGITAYAYNNTNTSVDRPQDILIENSYFSDFVSRTNPAHAIYISHALRATARGNTIHNVTNPNPAHNAAGVSISRTSQGTLVENNTITDSNFGLQVASEDGANDNSTIRNNLFQNMTYSGVEFWDGGTNTYIDLNTFNNMTGSGITLGGSPDPTNVHITNNVAISVTPAPIALFFPSAAIVELYNNSWQPGYVAPTPTPTPTPGATGDVNGDGHVTVADLSILAAHYGNNGMSRAQGDLNNDGLVNVFDLSILAAHWGV